MNGFNLFSLIHEFPHRALIPLVSPLLNRSLQPIKDDSQDGTITTTTAATTITAASTRPKAKGLVIHEQEQAPTPTVSSQQPSQLNVQDKGKGKMVEPEPMKKFSKKDQLMLDEELAFKLQAEEEEEDGFEVRVEGSDTRTEGSSKRVGEDLQQESIKKQKVDEDNETAELQRLIEVFLDNRGRNQWETWDLVLYGDLKTMFDPHVKDQVWKNQSDYRVLDWKLYDSCGVHSLRKQNVHIHMLVEKRYPLTAPTITYMLNRKLQADHWNEMCYQLLKLITKP
ncbi:hypothetical protein Tco_0111771 [Tanacetum coccineum]